MGKIAKALISGASDSNDDPNSKQPLEGSTDEKKLPNQEDQEEEEEEKKESVENNSSTSSTAASNSVPEGQ